MQRKERQTTQQAYVHVLNSDEQFTFDDGPASQASLRQVQSPTRVVAAEEVETFFVRAVVPGFISQIVLCEEEDSRMLGNAELIDDSWLVLASFTVTGFICFCACSPMRWLLQVCEPASDQQRRERLRHAHRSVLPSSQPVCIAAFQSFS